MIPNTISCSCQLLHRLRTQPSVKEQTYGTFRRLWWASSRQGKHRIKSSMSRPLSCSASASPAVSGVITRPGRSGNSWPVQARGSREASGKRPHHLYFHALTRIQMEAATTTLRKGWWPPQEQLGRFSCCLSLNVKRPLGLRDLWAFSRRIALCSADCKMRIDQQQQINNTLNNWSKLFSCVTWLLIQVYAVLSQSKVLWVLGVYN